MVVHAGEILLEGSGRRESAIDQEMSRNTPPWGSPHGAYLA